MQPQPLNQEYSMKKFLQITLAVAALTTGIAFAEEGKEGEKHEHEGKERVCRVWHDFTRDIKGVSLSADAQKDARELHRLCRKEKEEGEGDRDGGDRR
jgi:hypothetical protein